jgi:hypothetical protein
MLKGSRGTAETAGQTGKQEMSSCNQKAVLSCKKAGILPFFVFHKKV